MADGLLGVVFRAGDELFAACVVGMVFAGFATAAFLVQPDNANTTTPAKINVESFMSESHSK